MLMRPSQPTAPAGSTDPAPPRPSDKHRPPAFLTGYAGLRHRKHLIARLFLNDETASEIARACIAR